MLLTHFSQIYNTLGCVLQDLEYHIGRMQLQNSKLLVAEELHKENEQSNVVRNPRGRKTEREVIKIENSVDDPPIKKDRNSDKSARESLNTNKKVQYVEEAVKYESSEPRVEVAKAPKYH